MNRTIKKWVIGILLSFFFIALLIAIAIYFYIRSEFFRAVSIPAVDYFHMWEYDVSSDTVCVVTDRNSYIDSNEYTSNKYLFTTSEDVCIYYKPSTVLKGKAYWRYKTTRYVSKAYQIYDLRTQQLIKEYTLEEIESHLPEGYILAYPCPQFYSERNGEPYMLMSVCPSDRIETRNTNDTLSGVYLEINVLKGTIYLTDNTPDTSALSEADNQELSIFWDWGTKDVYPFLDANGFSGEMKIITEQDKERKIMECYWRKSNGHVELVLTGPALPVNNSRLYGMFPNLKQYVGNQDVTVNLLLSGYPSAEEIMELVLEEGQEVSFEGCVMGAEYSKDGQEHEIRSFEEYNKWRKYKD